MTTYYANTGTCGLWTASTAYTLGTRVAVDYGASTGFWSRVYECTTAGTSGGTRPSWTATVGNTTTDNTAVWTCRTPTTWANAGRVHHLIFAVTNGPMVAGDDIFVKNTSDENYTGNISFAFAGNTYTTSPVRVFSTDSTSEPPTTMVAGASWRCTGNVSTNQSNYEFHGMTLVAGSGGAAANFQLDQSGGGLVFRDCRLKLLSTTSTNRFYFGLTGSSSLQTVQRFENCVFTFGHISQRILIGRTPQEFVNCSLDATGAIPTTLFEFTSTFTSALSSWFQGCDFSALGSGTLMDLTNCGGNMVFRNCKLHSGAVSTSTPVFPFPPIILDNCDSADTNYRMTRISYSGTITTETTRVKTGGASDGTTTISWKIVANATITSRISVPIRCPAITTWNESTGSAMTLSVDILHDSGTGLTNGDIWLEVEYLGTSGTSKASNTTGRCNPPATTTTHPTSTATWVTTGLVTPNKQTLSVTVTPQEKGPLLVWVCAAKASYTVYVDPLLSVA